jgi:hypothetical protein
MGPLFDSGADVVFVLAASGAGARAAAVVARTDRDRGGGDAVSPSRRCVASARTIRRLARTAPSATPRASATTRSRGLLAGSVRAAVDVVARNGSRGASVRPSSS